jgi:hypothetical protein
MWRVVRWERPDSTGRVTTPPLAGYTVFDASGHHAIQLMSTDVSAPRSRPVDSLSADELRRMVRGYTAFFDTYCADAATGTLTYHLEGGLNSLPVGTELRRHYRVAGDTLTVEQFDRRGRPAGTFVYVRVH